MKKVLFVSILLLLCNSIAKAWDATDLEMYFPFIFDFDNSTREATIISLKGSADIKAIRIPDIVVRSGTGTEFKVTTIAQNAFRNCSGITGTLTIGKNITIIENGAFEGCSGLTGSLTIPNSVTSIGKNAFRDCSGFNGSLTIPNSVTWIGERAFSGCSGLTGSLTIPNSVTAIGAYAFAGCIGFDGPLTIPNSVTWIGEWAFVDCRGFNGSLTIPNSVTSIGDGAFSGCSGLTGSLVIPNSVIYIGEVAFRDCIGFDGSLTIPNSVTTIGAGAFMDCSGLTGSLTISNTVTTIERNTFAGCRGFNGSLTIPNSVTTIGGGAFRGCHGFNGSLTIPNSVTTIKYEAFEGCNGLSGQLNIPNTVTAIGKSAFSKCTGFSGQLTIPNSVTTIESGVFEGCTGFSGLIIPQTVTAIGDQAFSDCSGFTGPLEIPNTVTTIGSHSFSACSGFTGSLDIPNSVTTIGDGAFNGCNGFTGSLVIPNSVKEIGLNAFKGCKGFNGSLTIGNSVTAIRSGAFMDCNGFNGSLTIPNSVKSIGQEAFQGCSGLTGALALPGYLRDIGEAAFATGSKFSDVTYTTSEPLNNIAYSIFSDYSTTLYVYKDGVEKAKTTQPWSRFQNIEPIPIAPTDISLNPKGALLEVSDTIQFEVIYYPTNAYEKALWQSSMESVVKVDEKGLVTAVSPGQSIITVTTNETGLSASCFVVVKPSSAGSITLDYEDVSLNIGETVKLTATVLPEEASDKSVSWASSDPGIASVDENGTVTAVTSGKTTITATINDAGLSASCTVTVNAKPAESITLDHENVSLNIGETLKLIATVLPDNASDKSVTWVSSDSVIASIDESGLVTAISEGAATITATTNDGSELTASCAVTVNPKLAGSITLDHENVTLTAGETIKLTATVLPDDAPDKSVTWVSSDPGIASVDENGLVTAISYGETTITATTNDGSELTASCIISVREIYVESITLNIESATIEVGETVQLIATVLPENASDRSYVWESGDENIATIDENGLVTAVSVGETLILAKTNRGSASGAVLGAWFKLTVIPKGSRSITLDYENVSLNVGETVKLTATVQPDDIPDKSVSWVSSDPGVASVDENGLVTAVSFGQAIITATSNESGLSASCTVTVNPKLAGSITLDYENVSLNLGEVIKLTATVLPDNMADKSVSWVSSDPGIASVDENGLITAVSTGQAIITATSNETGLSASCTVTVNPKLVESITLDYETVSLNIGEMIKLTATVLPDDASDKSVSWDTSNHWRASVDENGMVTATSGGEVTITATTKDGSELTASCIIYVNEIFVESITLNIESASIEVGETVQLIATVLPENASDRSYFWKSLDETIAAVDENGLVTAVSVGQTRILACTNSASANGAVLGAWFDLTVDSEFAESITLDYENASLDVGETVKLTATVLPDDIPDRSVSWVSSDPWVASVDENGLVTAVSVGEATITATTNDGSALSASCTVTVNPTSAESITLDYENASLNVGETVKLTATVLPDDIPDRSVSWVSSDPWVASVDENGLVTAVSVGEATITATTNDGSALTASCIISVNQIFVESITLNIESATIEVGETVQLMATVLPENATDRSYFWGAWDETIATVDENGLVTAVSVGHTLIYAITNGVSACGPTLAAWFDLTVRPKLAESITLDYENVSLNIGETVKLTATVLPDNADNKSVIWSSSNPEIASVDEYGWVTAVTAGDAAITAATADGSDLSVDCNISVLDPSGIQHICNDNVTITVVDGSIVIKGLNHGVTTALISLDGHFWGIQKSENVPVVYKAVPGIYIVRIGNQSYKVVVRP